MSDIGILRRQRNGELSFLLIGQTDKGKKYLIRNFITLSEMVSIRCEDSEFEEIIKNIQGEGLTVDAE